MERKIGSLLEMEGFAKEVLESLVSQDAEATVIALSGDLGAGKTAFVKAVAKELGVVEHVTSPTFVIMKKYELKGGDLGFKQLVHIDAYRLNGGSELFVLGWKELLGDKHALILLEWPERVAEVLPQSTKTLFFEHVDENTRAVQTR